MTYYSREILEQYLKDTRFNEILDIIDEIDPYSTKNKPSINVTFCCDCNNYYTFGCPLHFMLDNGDIVDFTEYLDGFCFKGEEK